MTPNLGCTVLCERDEGYDTARRAWNGTIDRRPRRIVRPQSIADVMEAALYGLPLASLPMRMPRPPMGGCVVCGKGLCLDIPSVPASASLRKTHTREQSRAGWFRYRISFKPGRCARESVER